MRNLLQALRLDRSSVPPLANPSLITSFALDPYLVEVVECCEGDDTARIVAVRDIVARTKHDLPLLVLCPGHAHELATVLDKAADIAADCVLSPADRAGDTCGVN